MEGLLGLCGCVKGVSGVISPCLSLLSNEVSPDSLTCYDVLPSHSSTSNSLMTMDLNLQNIVSQNKLFFLKIDYLKSLL